MRDFGFDEQQVLYDCLKRSEAVLKRFAKETGYNSARDTPYIVRSACAMYEGYSRAEAISKVLEQLEQQEERRLWRRIKRFFGK